MRNVFLRYQTVLVTIFCLWLFLVIVEKLGFSFGVDTSILFRIFLFLALIYLTWFTKINWWQIYPPIKRILNKARERFLTKTKETQGEIFKFSPPLLTSRTGSFLSLFPALLFALFFLPWETGQKILREYIFHRITLFVSVVLGILVDVFIFKFTSDLVILVLIGLWIYSVWSFRLEGRVSVVAGLVFLLICPFLLILKIDPIAEKTAIWAYMFLLVGVSQMFIEYVKKRKRSEILQ